MSDTGDDDEHYDVVIKFSAFDFIAEDEAVNFIIRYLEDVERSKVERYPNRTKQICQRWCSQ